MSSPPLSIKQQIQNIFDNNRINDLNTFLKKRHCLNTANLYLVYLFHFIQSAGILTTTIATGYSITYLIWIGVGLNISASLIHIIEKTNNSISSKLLKDIQAIKDDKYIDEGLIVDIDNMINTQPNQLSVQTPLLQTDKSLKSVNSSEI